MEHLPTPPTHTHTRTHISTISTIKYHLILCPNNTNSISLFSPINWLMLQIPFSPFTPYLPVSFDTTLFIYFSDNGSLVAFSPSLSLFLYKLVGLVNYKHSLDVWYLSFRWLCLTVVSYREGTKSNKLLVRGQRWIKIKRKDTRVSQLCFYIINMRKK